MTGSGQRAARSGAAALVAALLLATAAPAGAQKALPPIKESSAVMPGGEGSASLEARVKRLESMLQGQALLDMLSRLQELQTEVQQLQGQNEVLHHEMEGIRKRQRELYLDIDRRLRQLSERPAPAASPGPTPGGAPGMAGQPGTPAGAQAGMPQAQAGGAADDAAEQDAYQAAFNLLKDGRYEGAINAFQTFLKNHPQSQFASNAQYWTGEANYVLRRFPAALAEFGKVLKGYPDSPKVPDAMLKIGYTHYELEQWPEARATLERLLKQYPQTTAAQLAQNRLNRMNLEGH